MAETTDITIEIDDNWVEIAGNLSAELSGFITVFSGHSVLYRQANTPPDDSVTVGHRLQPASDAVEFELLAGEFAYARAISPSAIVVITLTG